MSRGDWERRLPDGVHVDSRDRTGFRLGVAMTVGEDGLWPMRCPEHPEDHFFKFEVTVKPPGEASSDTGTEDAVLYCAYCGHAADLWDFAPEQHARVMAAATAAAEQYVSSSLDEMLGKSFGRSSRPSSRSSGISIEFKPGRPPRRRQLPEQGEIEETRRTMQCQACGELVAVVWPCDLLSKLRPTGPSAAVRRADSDAPRRAQRPRFPATRSQAPTS